MYDLKEETKMKGIRLRDMCCITVLGALILAIGVVGGILIGIYVNKNGEVNSESSNVNVRCIPNTDLGKVTTSKTVDQTTMKPTINTATNCSKKLCPKRNAWSKSTRPEIFAPLTNDEMKMIRETLIQKQIVSDRLGDELTLNSNYIHNMELALSNKRDILNYLDKNGKFPGRFAHVTVSRGSNTPPDLMVYNVGPLDESDINVESLYSNGDIAYNARPIDSVDLDIYFKLLEPIGDVLNSILKESCDGAYLNGGGLKWWIFNGSPGQFENTREVRANVMYYPFPSLLIYPTFDMLPVSVLIHSNGNDASKWYIDNFHYLNQGPYDTAEDLVNAYNNGSLRKFKLPNGYSETIRDRMYIGKDNTKHTRPFADIPPPRTYEPMGPRYTVNGHKVQWMGWSFDVTSKMLHGGAIYDIRYKNQRIAYELALNEIALIYGSDSFERSNVLYTDSTYAIGAYDGVLREIDCPGHATLLETSYYDAYSGTGVTRKSICVFENDGESAEWRHKFAYYQGGLRQSYLVVRFSSTIANYDYITDYEFRLDGKIFVKAKASGLIQTAFWDEENPNHDLNADSSNARDAFGYRVTDYGHGLIHDHMFGFKVDLDIIDTNNSFEVIHFKSGSVVDAFKTQNPNITSKPGYFNFNFTRYLEYETIHTERGYRVDLENPKFWTIVNDNYSNKWGAKRGYQIVPLATAIQTMVNAHPAMQALSFTKYTCAVTKFKDTEHFLTSSFDSHRLDNPKGDLDKMMDGENIVNEDLVNWVTIGFLHTPTAEDIPMTNVLESSFLLKPYNFFDKTDIFDMPHFYQPKDGNMQTPPEVDPCIENNPNV